MTGRPRSGARAWPWIAFAATLLVVVSVRIRLLGIPLERDEGEYAYTGQLLLQGVPPYALVYTMKFPGTYVAYALVEAVFGETVESIHLGLLGVNAAAIGLVFLLGRRLFDAAAGAVAAAAYAVLSVGPSVQGTSAHATHFVVVPALLGFLLLLRARTSGRAITAFAGGSCLGLAVLMKQHAVFFALFGLASVAWDECRTASASRRRCTTRIAVFVVGLLVPLGLCAAALRWTGVWGSFWFWTFEYASEYVSLVTLDQGLDTFIHEFSLVAGPSAPIWILGAAGVPLSFLDRAFAERGTRLLLFTTFSFLTVCPGLYFRPHYFVTLLPAVALLAGAATFRVADRLGGANAPRAATWIPAALAVLALGWPIVAQWHVLFEATPREASRAIYGLEPFPEAIEIARYVARHSHPDDRIVVLGAEPQIYYYARRRSATGYLYVYSVWEEHRFAERMAHEMIREIEAARPRYVVVEFIPERVGRWAKDYLASHVLRGRVDMISDDRTDYRWGERASREPANARRSLYVYERGDQGP